MWLRWGKLFRTGKLFKGNPFAPVSYSGETLPKTAEFWLVQLINLPLLRHLENTVFGGVGGLSQIF